MRSSFPVYQASWVNGVPSSYSQGETRGGGFGSGTGPGIARSKKMSRINTIESAKSNLVFDFRWVKYFHTFVISSANHVVLVICVNTVCLTISFNIADFATSQSSRWKSSVLISCSEIYRYFVKRIMCEYFRDCTSVAPHPTISLSQPLTLSTSSYRKAFAVGPKTIGRASYEFTQ